MTKLDFITVKGFKSIATLDKLRLGAINVVIGPNGCGKSNFIGVFSFLNAIREGRLQGYVLRAGGADRILHFGSKVTPSLKIHISFQNELNQYSVELQPYGADQLVAGAESVYYWNKDKFSRPYQMKLPPAGLEAGISSETSEQMALYVQDKLNGWRVYHFHDTSATAPMKKTCDVNDNRFLRPDGSNLAAFLFYLRSKHPGSYQLIRGAVAMVAPFFEDFQLEPQRLNPEKIILEWRHKGSDAYFDGSSISDGTLRFIALATLFLQPEELRPSVILVDEPELGLHPYAITMLSALIKQAARNNQVIVSTQSPLLLDNFEPEDVLVADRVESETRFTRLESARLESWLSDYSLGQLWEKNELGGRPRAE